MRLLPIAALILMATPVESSLAAPRPTGCITPRDACAFFDSYLSAFNRRDWDAFRATLADDVTVMFDSPALPERRDGRAAVEEAFRRVFPTPAQQLEHAPPALIPENLLAQDLGDVVVISFHIRDPDEAARRTVVLHRTPAGWRVVHIHGSSFATQAPGA